jgi:putative transferase (TIGR04331 family)
VLVIYNRANLLVTTSIKETCLRSDDEKIIFLGEWCKNYWANNFYIESDCVINYHLKDRVKFDCDYKYLEEFNERLIVSIANLLNDYHCTNKTVRFWRIIVGPWLLTYVSSMWDHWESLRVAFDEHNFDKTIFINENPYKHSAPSNHSDAVNLITNSNLWNHVIFSKILKAEYGSDIEFKYVSYHKTNELHNKARNDRKILLRHRISSWFDKFLGAIQQNEKIVFFNTFFGLRSFLRICLKLRCIPRLHNEFNQYIEMPRASQRNNLHLSFKANNRFETFIVKNISQDIPVSYLEGYNIIYNNVKNISRNCENIFTANAYWSNDMFKIFCANKSELGTKIIISEHGGAIRPKYNEFSHIEKISDVYAVWNKVLDNNRVRVQPNIISDKNNYKVGGVDLLIMGIKKSLYIRSYQSGIEGAMAIEDYNQKINFIKLLNSDIQKTVKIRTFDDSGWNTKQRYIDDLSKSNISPGMPLKKAFNSSKIIVCTYPQTTFQQAMHSKIPTILLYMKEYYEFHPEFDLLVKSLEDAKIVFSDPNDASNHINKIWENPKLWWNQPEVISAREMFFEYCGNVDDSWLDSWVSFFQKSCYKRD